MRRGSVVVLALALLATSLGLGQAAASGGTDVRVPYLGPGDALRVEESVRVDDASVTTERVVVAESPRPAYDARGHRQTTVPIVTYRGGPASADEATACLAHPSEPRALQRQRLREDFYETPLARAWSIGPDASTTPLDTLDRRLPGGAPPARTFVDRPCPGRSELSGRAYGPTSPPSLPELVPEPVPVEDAVRLEGEREPARTTFHGRPALWVNATFDVRLPGAYVDEDGSAREGPVRFSGEIGVLLADGIPAPARTDATVEVELGGEDGTVHRTLAWSTRVVAVRQVQGSVEGSVGDETRVSTVDGNLRYGPATGPIAERYPLREAIHTVQNSASPTFDLFRQRHPDAYLTSAVYRPDGATTDFVLEGVGASPPAGLGRSTGWTLTFHDDEATYRAATVRETDRRTGDPQDGPHGPSTLDLAWGGRQRASTDGELQRGTPIPRDRLPTERAPGSAVLRSLENHGYPIENVDRVHYDVGPGFPGSEPLVTYRFDVEGSQGEAADHAALVDVRTGELLALSSGAHLHQGEEGAGILPGIGPVERFGGGGSDGGAGRDAALPAGPAGGLELAAGATALLVGLLVKFLLNPLFSRISREELLENPVRENLLDRIREDPGVHLAALIDEAGVGNGATRHHLRKLVEGDLVETVQAGGYVRFFPAGEFSDGDIERRTVLKKGSNAEVYEAYQRDPDASIREVAREIDRAPSTVHHALTELREAGLL